MSSALAERVLEVWERGVELTVQQRAGLAVTLAGEHRHPAELTVHERDAALIRLRRSLFGDHYDGVVACPACETAFDLTIDLAAFDSNPAVVGPVRIEADGFSGDVRAPSCADLLALESTGRAEFASALFERCVIGATRDGQVVAVRDLPAQFRAVAAATLAAGGANGPAADLSCGECGHLWQAPIDVVRALLDEIDDWARRLLDDIHRIARAYHWSERDILDLPLRRRLSYLEAIG